MAVFLTQALQRTLYHPKAWSHAPCENNQVKEGQKPPFTSSSLFTHLLQSCIEVKSLQQGKSLHSQISRLGFERNHDLLPKLIKMYSTCGNIDDARQLFDEIPRKNLTVFSWTSMISGYIENRFPNEAVKFFCKMLETGVKPDDFTFSTLLKACVDLGTLRLIDQLHSMIIKFGFCSCLSVSNSLVHLYGCFGELESLWKVFDGMPQRDVVSWSSIIHAHSCSKKYGECLELFSRMQNEDGLRPNEVTIVAVMPAFGFFASLRRGQAIHAYVIRNGFSSNLIVGSGLVSMYSQCGDPDDAFVVFNGMDRKNVVLWTSMIEAYSMNGRFNLALNLFKLMQKEGLKPNYITFVVILSACSHGGLIDDGWEIFYSMREKFGVEPRVEHYACMVDMLGRAGKLEEAEKFLETISRPTSSIYGSLLGACRVHCNIELGERLADKLFELELDNAANYVMLSNIYASVGRWDEVVRVRDLMISKGLYKKPGCSWIEIKNKVYIFGAHDRSHSETEAIYSMLEKLGDRIVKAGYVPCTEFVLLDVNEDDKKKLLCSHSERLAIAFGLMKMPAGMPIRIAKNLRVCGDCHEAIKLISKVVSQELIIRDTNRFHHFCHGSCSCGDYW